MDGFLLCYLLIMCMVMKMAENAAPSLYSMNAHRVSVCVCVYVWYSGFLCEASPRSSVFNSKLRPWFKCWTNGSNDVSVVSKRPGADVKGPHAEVLWPRFSL